MADSKEDQHYTYLDGGRQIAMKPAKQTLRERLSLTDADLDWLAGEIGKRLAKQVRTGTGERV